MPYLDKQTSPQGGHARMIAVAVAIAVVVVGVVLLVLYGGRGSPGGY